MKNNPSTNDNNMTHNEHQFDIDKWADMTTAATHTAAAANGTAATGHTTAQHGTHAPSVPRTRTAAAVGMQDGDLQQQVREVARRLEARHADITCGYEAWRNLGFALADGLGEQGRDIYHSLSGVNPQYDRDECDRQYSACLRSHNGNITIRTFFKMAKEAGADIRTRHEVANFANWPK